MLPHVPSHPIPYVAGWRDWPFAHVPYVIIRDPTREFRSITLADIQAAPFDTPTIPSASLAGRILLLRDGLGHYGKLQIIPRADQTLEIVRLVMYSGQMVLRADAGLSVRPGYGFSLASGETTGAADFHWDGAALTPGTGVFALWPGFDDVHEVDLESAPYTTAEVEGPSLTLQLLYCRTRNGRYAVLLVEAGNVLVVRRLRVPSLLTWQHKPFTVLDVSVPAGSTLDVESGSVGDPAEFDLRWDQQAPGEYTLVTANGAMLSFPSYERFVKYLPLLRDATLTAAMQFEYPWGVSAYDQWLPAQRAQLEEYLYVLDTGAKPLTSPPSYIPSSNGVSVDFADAVTLYLAYVAHTLWVDANDLVPWPIALDADSLFTFFDSRWLLPRANNTYWMVRSSPAPPRAAVQWDTRRSFEFLQQAGCIQPDHWRTILALVDWCRHNLQHMFTWQTDPRGPFTSAQAQSDFYFGVGSVAVDVQYMFAPLPGRGHPTSGCWGTSAFLALLLRTVNIAVHEGVTHFADDTHSRVEFRTVGLNLIHSDDPYSGLSTGGYPAPMPIGSIFVDNNYLAQYIDQPVPLPGKTAQETATFNYEHRRYVIGAYYLTDWFLWLRCFGATGRWTSELSPYFTAAEMVDLESRTDNAIAALGGCANLQLFT
jgi:hypothetical protein